MVTLNIKSKNDISKSNYFHWGNKIQHLRVSSTHCRDYSLAKLNEIKLTFQDSISESVHFDQSPSEITTPFSCPILTKSI